MLQKQPERFTAKKCDGLNRQGSQLMSLQAFQLLNTKLEAEESKDSCRAGLTEHLKEGDAGFGDGCDFKAKSRHCNYVLVVLFKIQVPGSGCKAGFLSLD